MLQLFSLPNPAALSYGFAAAAFLAFAIHLGFGWRGGEKAALLVAAVGLSLLWASLNLAFALTGLRALWIVQTLSDALRSGAWILFASVLLAGAGALRWGLPALGALAVAAWLLARTNLGFGLFLVLSVTGLVLAEQLFRRAREQSRWSIKPLCLGLGASFVFDLYMYADALLLGRLDVHLWAARGFAQALVIPFIALATARNKDWTIEIALSPAVLFHSTAFLASGLYLLAVAAAGYYVRYVGGSWGRTFQAGFIFAALLLLGWLFFSGTLRARLRVFINKNFFPYRYDYRREWLRFTSLLAAPDAGVSPQQRCIEALANLVESPAGALWMREGDGAYVPAARWNMQGVQVRESAESPLARFLAKTGWVINLDDYREDAARYPGLEAPAWLTALGSAWLVVPLVAQDELTGFVVLGAPRAAIEVNWEVLDLLKTAARQVGSFLAQVRASEALLEARKFEAFNKMSAFVVHDLKNVAAQLSLLLKNAERHRDNPRFQADMLSTVQHVSERMGRLLAQLRGGSPAEEAPRPIDVGRLARRVVQQKSADRADIAVESTNAVLVTARESRFERVIGHLVQNAIDATRAGGSVRVGVFAERGRAVLEVADTGCGMSEEFMRERLFRPFETTKAAGMGIGAFETAQVVKEMGGSIQADSREGAGTRIRLDLPLCGDAAVVNPAREAA